MGKNFDHQESLEHRQGCMKGMFNHFHNHTLNFARKKLPYRKCIAVDEDDDRSRPSQRRPSQRRGERRRKYDSRMDDSADAAKVSEPGSVHKRSVTSWIKTCISEEVSKRKGRHKRSSSCPPQTRRARNSPIQGIETLDKSNVQVNEDITSRSAPKVQEEVATTPSTCDLRTAMSRMNSWRQSEFSDKGKRPVKNHAQDKPIYPIEPSRRASLEESRLFLDALDLLNMRKELFLNVLRDPSSSLAQQLHEKRLSKLRVRLTKSMSFPCPKSLEEKDVNFNHEGHHLTHEDTKFLPEVQKSGLSPSVGESNGQKISLAACLGDFFPEQSQRPSGNVSPVSRRHLNTRQDKIVIKRFKNLREIIRHTIKDTRKDRQHIIKDAMLHKIPNDKNSKGYKGQGDTSEKPPKIYMKSNLGQKSFDRAPSFSDSFEKYNRLLDSDSGREANGKETERVKLRTTVTPSPITSIPKRLNRIYSSPDLGLYHGLHSEEPLDSTCPETSVTSIWVDCSSNEVNVISSKQTCLEFDSSTENQIDNISKYETQENCVDTGEGLDAISKCENIEGADKDSDEISKCESRENSVDADENQENIEDAGEDLGRISKSDSRENIEDVGEGSDRISICESQENSLATGDGLDISLGCDSPLNIEDIGEDLDKISKCETGKNFVEAGFDYTGDLKSRYGASNIPGVAYDSSYLEDNSDPAKYNLQDDSSVADDVLLDGTDFLVSQQHELSRDGPAIYENEKGSSYTWFHDTGISQIQVDKNSRFEFDYVKSVLDLSGFNRDEFLGQWHSPGQPVDPAVIDEVEVLLVQSELSEIEDRSWDHVLLFDLVNEVLLDTYHKSSSYWPKSLYFRSCIHPMPVGYHVHEVVWADINCYLRWEPTSDRAYIDDGDAVAQDLAKYDGWMNLQFDSECVGLELEELLFDDLLEELVSEIQTS